MRLQSVWNVLLAVGYWCLIHVAKAQIQTDDQYSTQVLCPANYDGFCLNGGTCLQVQVGHNQRTPRCQCTHEYVGRRCERYNPVYMDSQGSKPEDKNYVIVGAVCGAVILLALVGIICILVRKTQSQDNSPEPLVTREALV
ncbi:PREDICTED: tomoregulin-2-like isoform X4 [Branchiostoma belcheri]|uniref:Tomoregulin-2-like isoform X4 n=1 Tax=Branchiostoma belcheri TaxID=7741 RepID=A0A6P4ZHL5_BRABE|nr:PREDICTED: tomoregulin-2-like isoform X4 [Branchiostoma belcheri]